MLLPEAASLLGLAREHVESAISVGVRTPQGVVVRLVAVALPSGYDIAQDDLDAFIAAFETEEPGRHPPVSVRRTLLIESGYKCSICRGDAPLEFHHIIEWATIRHHDPSHMLAACSNCHAKITRYGQPDPTAQRQIKATLVREREAFVQPRPVPQGELAMQPSLGPQTPAPPRTAPPLLGSPRISTPKFPPLRAKRQPVPGPALPVAASDKQIGAIRTIFANEITHAGPSADELAWVATRLFAGLHSSAPIEPDGLLALRTLRAIVEIQRMTHPEATWTTWTHTSRLREATANVMSEFDYDLPSLDESATRGVELARSKRCLQFTEEDEWRPGMASGSGWVEKVSLSLIGEKVLQKDEAPR